MHSCVCPFLCDSLLWCTKPRINSFKSGCVLSFILAALWIKPTSCVPKLAPVYCSFEWLWGGEVKNLLTQCTFPLAKHGDDVSKQAWELSDFGHGLAGPEVRHWPGELKTKGSIPFLWGGVIPTTSFLLFFCFPSFISGVHHFGWDFWVCDCLSIQPFR